MSGGFTESERERIREQLVAEGRELFAQYGLKKTTISDLTEPIGIANGTFYQFFDSKTDLYVEVLEREGDQIAPRILSPLEEYDDPERAIKEFLTALMDEIETNPLVRRLVVEPEEMRMLREYHTDEELAEDREESLQYILPYAEEWHKDGAVNGPDPRTVASAIRSVSLLTLHREDIGEELYDETRDLVIRSVAKGLTSE